MRAPHVAAARTAAVFLAAAIAAAEATAAPGIADVAGTARACVIDGESWGYRLGPHLAFLEDPTGELGPDEALSPERAASYVSRAAQTISLGYSKSAFWFKGEARNESGRDLDCVLVLKEPAIESVELFARGERLRSGAAVAVSERAVPSRESAFKMRLKAGETEPILLRVRTDTSINLSFVLFEEDAYGRREAAGIFVVSLCFGALFFAIVYNAFLAVSLRDPAYGFYAVLVAGILLNRLLVLGYFQYYLAPGSGRLNYYAILTATSLFTAAMGLYNASFLSTRTRTPFLHGLNVAVPIGAAANMAVLAFDAHLADQLTIALLLAAVFVSIATGARAWAKGFRPARYYILAWAALLAVVLVHGLGLFGIVAYSMYSDEATLIGTVAMSLLMSLALADRIGGMRRDKEQAQARAIESQRVLNEELEKQVKERTALLAKANDELKILSTTDRLTGIANRMKLEHELGRLMSAEPAPERPLSIIMADVDHFKRVNDEHGHQTGDAVLSEIASLLQRSTRAADSVGRWGGEEFLILCADTGRDGATAVAEKLRRLVEEHEFPVVGRMTCSFGVGAYERGASRDELIRRADEALYRAKGNGRNRVESDRGATRG